MDPTTRLDGADFEDAVDEFVKALESLRTVFVESGPELWVRELDGDLDLIRRRDSYGFDRFLGHFGSMGSLGDVGVGEAEPLLSRAHLLASVLRRSLSR